MCACGKKKGGKKSTANTKTYAKPAPKAPKKGK
jgi:hypothetical protein